MKKIILLLSCVFFGFKIFSNDINWNFQKITLEDGLTDNRYNNFIFEDSRGFVWISSIAGLNRYDGLQVKSYRFESGLKTNNIQSKFFEDKMGNIWFTTYDAINCYSVKSDSIYNYNIQDESTGYQAFFLDTITNYLWLRTANNIYKWNIYYNADCELIKEGINSRKIRVKTDLNSALEKIAILEKKDMLKIIDIQNSNSINTFKIPASSNFIHLENTKWLLYNKSSIFIFDEKKPFDIPEITIKPNINIFDLIKHRGDLLFLSTQNDGLWLYNWRENDLVQQFKHNVNDVFSLSSNSPKHLYLSPSGFLWTNHQNIGINYTSISNSKFYNPLSEVTNIEITSVVEAKDGKVWISSRKNGVFVCSVEGEFIFHFKYPFESNDQTELWQITEHEELGIIGLTTIHIYKFDLNNKTISNLIPRSDTLTFRFIYKVFPDRYLISSNHGIIEIAEEYDNYYINHCKELEEYNEFSFAQIYQTNAKKVLIPYRANQLWTYKAYKDNLKLIGKNDSCNLEFFGFFESLNEPGSVWAGTSNGLKLINANNGINSVFSDNSELANGDVYGVIEDYDGNLWLTTNKGLWKYNPEDLTKYHFEEADGLSGELFSFYNSTLLASNGTIWLGNNKGLVVFHQDSIIVHKEVPKVHLEDLLVNDTKSFKNSIEPYNRLDLNYNENTLTFDIRAINLYKTKQNKIHYQLENYDKKWLQINNGEKIRYTQINHGNYVLKVYAEDANGNKGDIIQLLTFNIKPPFWRTHLFAIFLILLIGSIVFSIYKLRVNFLIREQAEKMENERIKEEMKALRAQMNPHFLFNAMNAIKGLIIDSNISKAAEYLTKFSSLLRKVLSNSEKQKINLVDELESLKLYIQLESLRLCSIFIYNIHIDSSIHTDFIRIPPLILQPFVENAIWHGLLPKKSDAKNLNINILSNGDFLILEIIDNGVGRGSSKEQPKNLNKKPRGISITKRRIELDNPQNLVQIIDLIDNEGKASGTKVSIHIYSPK